MPWEDILLPIKLSKEVRDFQNDPNLNNNFDGKYIGIIPLVWNPLAFYKKSNGLTLDEYFNDMSLETEDHTNSKDCKNIKNNIKNITTSKDIFLVKSVFYYLLKDNQSFYPVFKYDESLPFTTNHIRDLFTKWLSDIGYFEPYFIPIRIYKMKGFHLFGLILDSPITSENLNKQWGCYSSLPMLHLKNSEITNSMMKVSQSHYSQSVNNNTFNNTFRDNTWTKAMYGCLMGEDIMFPFKVNFEQIIATLSNQIDCHSRRHSELYFIPEIITNTHKRPIDDQDPLSSQQKNKKIKL